MRDVERMFVRYVNNQRSARRGTLYELVLSIYVKKYDNLIPSFIDYSERRTIMVSNMLEMDVLYYLDYQRVTKKLFLRTQKNNHFDPISRLTCIASVIHFIVKPMLLTCKTNTIKNQFIFFPDEIPPFSCRLKDFNF